MEDYLTDGSEVLFRQIHPTFVVDGYPSSQPFQPTEKDDNKLSVDRSAVTDAASAFALYARNGHRSAAVYGLSVEEFKESNLPCVSDPLESTGDHAANPAHAYADYSQHGTNKAEDACQAVEAQGARAWASTSVSGLLLGCVPRPATPRLNGGLSSRPREMTRIIEFVRA